MISAHYVRLMAAYTAHQNASQLECADTLDDDARQADRGAFFGSIQATFNHVLWGDQIWMHRLAGTPAPAADGIAASVGQYPRWSEFVVARRTMDREMLEFSRRVTSSDLEGEYRYYSKAMGAELVRPRWVLVLHMFNHGTHHRGQLHAMLTAAGCVPADTDVPFFESEHWHWDRQVPAP